MKQTNKLSLLAVGAVVISLLLGAGTALAVPTVILDGNNNVIRIENLEVINQLEEVTVYDVTFEYDTGVNVYGAGFDFDFTQEEDGIFALNAVIDALNVNNPTPTGAGPQGTDQFFIGVEVDTGLIAAVGGENFLGQWDKCDTDCLLGTAVLDSTQVFTYADFTPASGGPSDPIADANGPYTGTAGISLTFDGTGSIDPDGSIVTYAWEFGDSSTGSGATPSHTYSTAGKYNVTLTITDNSGITDTDSTEANIGAGNLPPVADANGPYLGQTGVSVSFDGTGSSDPDGSITDYVWDFGDGTPTGSGATPSHTYSATGNYLVSLTVTDDSGATDSNDTTAAIGVGNQPPVADADGPYLGQAGVSVSFDGTASSDPGGSIVSYAWDFGDGTSGSGATPSHTYTADGTYLVTLEVTDDSGATDSDGSAAVIGSGNLPQTAVAASSLPSSRSVQVGSLVSNKIIVAMQAFSRSPDQNSLVAEYTTHG